MLGQDKINILVCLQNAKDTLESVMETIDTIEQEIAEIKAIDTEE